MENVLPIVVLVAVIGVMLWLVIGFVRDIIKYRKNKNNKMEDDKDNGRS